MPVMIPDSDLTALLQQLRHGDAQAQAALHPVVYDTLRRIAHQRLQQFRPGETLNTTALVHEAFLKLVDQTHAMWQDRAHFFATASRAMRFILIDYARARTAARRGGPQAALPLEAQALAVEERAADLLALDEALTRLAALDPHLGSLVEQRFFAGMTYEEIATVTGRSVPTVKRDWQRARAWLYQMMRTDTAPEATTD